MFANSGWNENFFVTSLLHSRNSCNFLVKKVKGKQEQCQQAQRASVTQQPSGTFWSNLCNHSPIIFICMDTILLTINSMYRSIQYISRVCAQVQSSIIFPLNFQRISTFTPMALMRTCKITVLWCSHQCKGQMIFLARPDAVCRDEKPANFEHISMHIKAQNSLCWMPGTPKRTTPLQPRLWITQVIQKAVRLVT